MTPLLRFLLLTSLALGPGLALAQSQTPPVPEAVVAIPPLEVTAPRISDTPANVSTLSLESLPVGQDNLAGLASQTANFFVANNNARSYTDIFSLRGLTNTPIFGTPSVSVYLDDLPLGSGFTFPSELTGFTTATLYRGPGQNTLFGRAGPAGVLEFTTPTPPPDDTPVSVLRTSVGNYNAYDASATTSVGDAKGDVLVAADYAERGGYITNTELKTTIDGEDSSSALARLRYRPAANTEFTLLFTALDAHDGVQPLVPIGGPLFSVTRPSEGLTDTEAYNTALTAAITTPIGKLSATTSYDDWEIGPYSDLLKLSPSSSLFLGNSVEQTQHTWSEELKLTGNDSDPIHWSTGAFYSGSTTSGNVARLIFGAPVEASTFMIGQHSVAVFGEATFKLGDAFTLTPGLRVEENYENFLRHELVPVPGVMLLNDTSSAVLPKLAGNYTLSAQTALFASVGLGYKPGGFSSFTAVPAYAPFGPERTTAYEVGLTHTSSDHQLTTTLRGFWYDITGYQIERSFATGPNTSEYFVANAARARSVGAELELQWKPVAGLTLTSAVGYTDAILVHFNDPVSGQSFDGNRAPDVPAYTASLRADYEDPSGWFGGVGLTADGRTDYTENENALFAQPAYALLNAHLGYGAGRWRVSVYGNNLTNKGYYSSISPGVYSGSPGAPLTYGVQVSVKF